MRYHYATRAGGAAERVGATPECTEAGWGAARVICLRAGLAASAEQGGAGEGDGGGEGEEG
ncbi:MAG TPA: hypothetical protein VFC13_07430, partial [Actinomycetes bacterium]|nr:hypothetical protein [Actinomycetes bacterium]